MTRHLPLSWGGATVETIMGVTSGEAAEVAVSSNKLIMVSSG